MTAKIFNRLAAEGIKFQSDLFAKELTAAFEQLKTLKKDEIPDSAPVSTIEAIIKHHTGLTFSLDLGDGGPHVEAPAINKNNALIVDIQRNSASSADGMAMVKGSSNLVSGSINFATGMVTGIFTKIIHRLAIPLNYIIGKTYTAGELAAVCLHEVGHVVVYYEFITRSVSTNQILAGMSKALDGSGNVVEREAILLTTHKALRLGAQGVGDLAKSTNSKVVEAVVLSNVIQQSVSELGSNIYDMTSWEYLSDEFATRHGAGRDLVTALDKVYGRSWNRSFRSTPMYYAVEAVKVLYIVSMVVSLQVFPLIASMLVYTPGRTTYDTPEARFKRIKNQITENLKDKNLSSDDRERLLVDIDVVEGILGHVNDRSGVFEVIWRTINPAYARAWDQERLQRDLEDIASSDLFIKAAKFKELKV